MTKLFFVRNKCTHIYTYTHVYTVSTKSTLAYIAMYIFQ